MISRTPLCDWHDGSLNSPAFDQTSWRQFYPNFGTVRRFHHIFAHSIGNELLLKCQGRLFSCQHSKWEFQCSSLPALARCANPGRIEKMAVVKITWNSSLSCLEGFRNFLGWIGKWIGEPRGKARGWPTHSLAKLLRSICLPDIDPAGIQAFHAIFLWFSLDTAFNW